MIKNGVHIKGDLDLSNCNNLKSLGNLKSVGVDLYIYGCTSLKTLPTDMKIGGVISGASSELKERYKERYKFYDDKF